jgi:transposase
MFEIAPRLADAYRIKNEFLTIFHSKSSTEGRPRLVDWLLSVEAMQMPEFNDCVTAYRNWFQEILNSMDVPWSNGYIEGCNNKTKVLKVSVNPNGGLQWAHCKSPLVLTLTPEPSFRHDP